MKKILILLLIFNFALHANPFQTNPLQKPGKVSIEWIKENITKDFGDELFLKERLKKENPLIDHGEVRGHKVGNGFSIPGPESKFQLQKVCHVTSDLEFLILKNNYETEMAILTKNRESENLAEFSEVNTTERHVGFSQYTFTHGTNPLRGEMFQLEWFEENKGLLRIVYQEKLEYYLLTCEVL